jgi:glycosyltransferase involved in cell wall biosynthesis
MWCTKFLCVSERTASDLFGSPRSNALPHGRVAVLPHGIDMRPAEVATTKNWREHFGLGPETRIIGYLGRLSPIKGPDLAVRAIAPLVPELQDVHLVVAGDGPERGRLETLVQSLQVDQWVHFAGPVPHQEVFSAIKGFDIAVVPSRSEGFGLTALEVMACGIPLIASDADALVDVIPPRARSLQFRAGDAESLALSLRTLLNQPALAKQLGEDAAQHARMHFAVDARRRRLLQLFDGIGLPSGAIT